MFRAPQTSRCLGVRQGPSCPEGTSASSRGCLRPTLRPPLWGTHPAHEDPAR